jgi:hypothetical protein
VDIIPLNQEQNCHSRKIRVAKLSSSERKNRADELRSRVSLQERSDCAARIELSPAFSFEKIIIHFIFAAESAREAGDRIKPRVEAKPQPWVRHK